MLRFSLLAAVALLAAGFTGCTHCDTCDDFPVPCVGHNTAVPMAPGGSYSVTVGGDQPSSIMSRPASPTAPTAVTGAPAPPAGAGPFRPPVVSSDAVTPNLDPLPRSGDVTPPAPSSVGSAKAN